MTSRAPGIALLLLVLAAACGVKKPPTPILEGVAPRIRAVTPTPAP